jgi:hypothetical protein
VQRAVGSEEERPDTLCLAASFPPPLAVAEQGRSGAGEQGGGEPGGWREEGGKRGARTTGGTFRESSAVDKSGRAGRPRGLAFYVQTDARFLRAGRGGEPNSVASLSGREDDAPVRTRGEVPPPGGPLSGRRRDGELACPEDPTARSALGSFGGGNADTSHLAASFPAASFPAACTRSSGSGSDSSSKCSGRETGGADGAVGPCWGRHRRARHSNDFTKGEGCRRQ